MITIIKHLLRWSHFPGLHVLVWIEEPAQVLLVASHDRPRCWVPGPQVTEHSVHSDHGDQPASLSNAGRQECTKEELYFRIIPQKWNILAKSKIWIEI